MLYSNALILALVVAIQAVYVSSLEIETIFQVQDMTKFTTMKQHVLNAAKKAEAEANTLINAHLSQHHNSKLKDLASVKVELTIIDQAKGSLSSSRASVGTTLRLPISRTEFVGDETKDSHHILQQLKSFSQSWKKPNAEAWLAFHELPLPGAPAQKGVVARGISAGSLLARAHIPE